MSAAEQQPRQCTALVSGRSSDKDCKTVRHPEIPHDLRLLKLAYYVSAPTLTDWPYMVGKVTRYLVLATRCSPGIKLGTLKRLVLSI